MMLKVNELFKRAITGFIYIFLLLSAIALDVEAFDFLFLSFGIICLFEFKKLIKLRGLHIFVTFLFTWWVFIHLETTKFLVYLFCLLIIIVNCYLALDMFSKKKSFKFKENSSKFLVSLLYIGGGCIFVPLIYRNEEIQSYTNFDAKITMIGILCIIWASDSFAYLIGKNFGRNKLFERISPKKTIEGSLGGMVGAITTAVIISYYSDKTIWEWILLATILVIAGTLGDLVESRFKRSAKVKDSGNILPGHGGLLDRLDSLIFAAPFAYLTLQIINYVS